MRSWLLRRPQVGYYERLLNELLVEDTQSYTNFMRMEPAIFQEVLGKIGSRITKEDTYWRKASEPSPSTIWQLETATSPSCMALEWPTTPSA